MSGWLLTLSNIQMLRCLNPAPEDCRLHAGFGVKLWFLHVAFYEVDRQSEECVREGVKSGTGTESGLKEQAACPLMKVDTCAQKCTVWTETIQSFSYQCISLFISVALRLTGYTVLRALLRSRSLNSSLAAEIDFCFFWTSDGRTSISWSPQDSLLFLFLLFNAVFMNDHLLTRGRMRALSGYNWGHNYANLQFS